MTLEDQSMKKTVFFARLGTTVSLIALSVLSGCGLSSASVPAPAPQMQAGYYLWTGYITSATAACNTSIGATYTGTEYYPGPDNTGHIIHTPINTNGSLGVVVSTYPTTPSAGTLVWTGTAASTRTVNGVSTDEPYTFQVNYTFVDNASFETIATQSYSNGCVFTIQLSHVLTGH